METIRVNMTPCDDVQTIHASQNDNEAREWGFELHNNGEKIDSSSISDQMVFKAYEGGTEQILPENTSTPTTSPFLGDIRYPQGLLTDQEFTYRQSPTEEDGLAKITDIKGNTLVWNQLVDTLYTPSGTVQGITRTALGNGGVRVSGTATVTDVYTIVLRTYSVERHKILLDVGCELPSGSRINGASQDRQRSVILTVPSFGYQSVSINIQANTSIDVNAYPQVFDLTQMFGAGNEPTIEEFSSLFPLSSYHAYNAGTLLSFNGTGLKSASEDASKEDTLALPVATYFPTGMKSAGNVYDELNDTKAITRIGVVDLGTLDWELFDSRFGAYFGLINKTGKTNADLFPMLCAKYQTVRYYRDGVYMEGIDKSIAYAPGGGSRLYVEDSSYSDAVAFKTAMNGVYLCYELATPIETSFTTASLVTENVEIPLSNDDGVLIGKCTEELSSQPGFIDAKIKLADGDGACYSNKLQLHVERKP